MTHQHDDGLSCSCGNPLWKMLLPDVSAPVGEERQSDVDVSPKTLIVHGGYLQTLQNGENLPVEAIGISKGLVVATGSLDEVREAMPAGADERELVGKESLFPGLIEAHLHILPTAVFNMGIDLGPFEGQSLRGDYGLRSVIEQLSQSGVTLGDWLIGHNVDPSLFRGIGSRALSQDILDEVSTQIPIFVLNASMHIAYVNRCAFKVVLDRIAHNSHISEESRKKELEVVSELQRSSNGILKELVQIQPLVEYLPKPTPVELKASVDGIFEQAASRGVTYVLDAGVELDAEGSGSKQRDYLSAVAKHDCKVRIGCAMLVASQGDFSRVVDGGLLPNTGDETFNMAFLKLISDGSNQGLTGFQRGKYDCDDRYRSGVTRSKNKGLFNFEPDAFKNLVGDAVAQGWPLMIHANGDRAIERTIAAFDHAGLEDKDTEERRDRIEHASLLSNHNLSDMRRLGLSPSFLIGHVGYWGWVFKNTILGKSRSNELDRCKSALERGLRISLHSDNSVTPLGPIRMMEQAIGRMMEGAPHGDDSSKLNKDETISRFKALKAVTYDAAWQCHADKWVGSLEVGKCADFVILAESPLTYHSGDRSNPIAGMRDIPVVETWKGGVKTFERSQ